MTLRRYHAAVWDEPLVMELGAPGRRGVVFDEPEADIARLVGDLDALVPAGLRRSTPPELPELSEPEVLRHYLHLSQETLGMMGVSLFGTCTMKYNPRLATELAARPEIAELHPDQDDETLQGVLELVHGLDLILRGLSGMDAFVFQPGGGAHAAYTHAVITRAYHASRGELEQRDEIVTTIQAHPCNAATANAAGFNVVTLPLEEHGYPSLDALKAAVSDRTASLMVNNPDDMGVYNPEIEKWVEVVHDAGGLCFYDHANFNGVMGRLKARELGFDACMYMLHKTFGAPKGGGGPAVGAYGCSDELARFLPEPIVVREGDRYRLDRDEARLRRQGEGLLGQRAAARLRVCLEPRHGCGRDQAGRGHLGPREQLHGEAAARDPRRHQVAAAPHRAAARDDAVQPRHRRAGHGHHGLRRAEPHGRLRNRCLLAQPRAVDRASALHAGGRRDVVEGGHRRVDRRRSPTWSGRRTATPRSCAPRRTTRS